MKIVQEIKTSEIIVIKDVDFDSNLYIDFSLSIYHWYYYGISLLDYVYARTKIKEISTQQEFANVKYKDEAALVGAGTDTEIIGYYMAKGMSQLQAIEYHTLKMAGNYRLAGACYSARLDDDIMKATIIGFIGNEQGTSLLESVKNYKIYLKEVALLGTQYNNDRDGIMDVFENTGSHTITGVAQYAISELMINVYGSEEAAKTAFTEKLHELMITKYTN